MNDEIPKPEMYETKMTDEEKQRLESLSYPSQVSESILGRYDIQDQNVLDAGSGPNPDIAQFVEAKGGQYFSLDLRLEALTGLRDNTPDQPFRGVEADVRKLPFKDNSFDLIHQRFVLMNISPETRLQALREVMRVCKHTAILLEYNWETFQSSKNSEFVAKTKEVIFEALAQFQTDPYMGSKLEDLLKEAQAENYSIEHFQREESDGYSPELQMLLQSLIAGLQGKLQKLTENNSEAVKDLDSIVQNLTTKLQELIQYLGTNKVSFSPPEIVSATVETPNSIESENTK